MELSKLLCVEFTAEEYKQIYRSYGNEMDILLSLKDDADTWRNKIVNKGKFD